MGLKIYYKLLYIYTCICVGSWNLEQSLSSAIYLDLQLTAQDFALLVGLPANDYKLSFIIFIKSSSFFGELNLPLSLCPLTSHQCIYYIGLRVDLQCIYIYMQITNYIETPDIRPSKQPIINTACDAYTAQLHVGQGSAPQRDYP